MAAINTNVGSSILKFTFSDDDGEVLASFRMNPADAKLAKRCMEVSEYFEKIEDQATDATVLDDIVRINDEMEEKICYLLGYDARASLFGLISATSVMVDGNLFVVHVMNKIQEHVAPEIRKRQQAMADAVAQHTAKYTK